MDIMKFFRKHNRKMLGVLMALLMIVFLGGSALENMLTPSANFLIAESNLGPITEFDKQMAMASTGLLEKMGLGWSRPMPGIPEPLNHIDWVLLNREAKKLGTFRNVEAMRNLMGDKNLSEQIEFVSRSFNVKTDRVIEAMGELQSVQETARTIGAAAIPSEAELRNAARLGLEKVKIATVVLTGNMFVDPEQQFTDAEIAAQFEKYKEKPAGRGLDFGYRIGPAARIQYIKIDRSAIAGKIGIANSEARAKKFWEAHRERNPRFFKTPEELDRDRANPNPDGTPKPPYKDWEAAKDIALELSREDAADDAAKKLADWLISYLSEPWLGAETGEDGFKKAPPGVEDLAAFQTAIQRVPSTLAFPDAVSVAATDFFTADVAAKVAGDIGFANVPPERNHPRSLTALVFNTKGFVKQVPREKGVQVADYSAPYQTFTLPLQDGYGNVYVFRVLETRDPRVPASPEEVREKVIADLRMQKGYERAIVRAHGLKDCLGDVTLKQAYDADEELNALRNRPIGWGSGYFEPVPFSRTYLAAASRNEREPSTFLQGGIGPIPNAIADAFFDLEFASDPIAVYEVRDRVSAMVVQWIETIKVPEDEYTRQRDQIMRDMGASRVQTTINDWLTPDKIRARTGYLVRDSRQ